MPKIIIGCLNHPKKDCFAYCKKGCSVTLNCDCIGCKFYKSKRQYNEDLIKHDIALSRAIIRSKDAEIEKLEKKLVTAKIEAIKEFAKRLKMKAKTAILCDCAVRVITEADLYGLLKETVRKSEFNNIYYNIGFDLIAGDEE